MIIHEFWGSFVWFCFRSFFWVLFWQLSWTRGIKPVGASGGQAAFLAYSGAGCVWGGPGVFWRLVFHLGHGFAHLKRSGAMVSCRVPLLALSWSGWQKKNGWKLQNRNPLPDHHQSRRQQLQKADWLRTARKPVRRSHFLGLQRVQKLRLPFFDSSLDLRFFCLLAFGFLAVWFVFWTLSVRQWMHSGDRPPEFLLPADLPGSFEFQERSVF